MIEIKNLYKKYGKKEVLSNVSLNIKDGETILLAGANGSGKTTFIKILLGLIKYDGQVEYGEKTFCGMVETPKMYEDFTGMENLHLLLENPNDEKIKEISCDFGIYEDMNRKVKHYSLGMRQKLALIYLILKDTDVLVLDEPFNSLDYKSRQVLISKLYERREKINVIVSHQTSDMYKICNQIYEIKDKKIEKREVASSSYKFVFNSEEWAVKAKEVLPNGKVIHNEMLAECNFDEITLTIKKLCDFNLIAAYKDWC